MVICLERGADCLHMALLMPLPLSVSCFSEIQIGFTFLVPVHLGSPGQWAGSLGWPFPTLKIKCTEAILSIYGNIRICLKIYGSNFIKQHSETVMV